MLKSPNLLIFGNDYKTSDGTVVRDYIHVLDLAEGHLAALNSLGVSGSGWNAINLGTGKGTSVLKMIEVFSLVNSVELPFIIEARRPGDIASSYASRDIKPKANKIDVVSREI